jgi:hypothetical protein
MASQPLSDELTELHNTYVWEINAAVDREDDEFLERLSDEYTERALRVITAPRRAS